MKNILISKTNKGFTLIELLLFMGIFSILLIAMLELLTSVFDVQLESQSSSSISRDSKYILGRLSYDIKNSISIATPSAGSNSSSLILSNGSTTYTYSLSGGNLMLQDSTLGTNDRINSINTRVSSLNFLRLSTLDNAYSTVTVTFTLTGNTIRRGGADSQNFRLTSGTR